MQLQDFTLYVIKCFHQQYHQISPRQRLHHIYCGASHMRRSRNVQLTIINVFVHNNGEMMYLELDIVVSPMCLQFALMFACTEFHERLESN